MASVRWSLTAAQPNAASDALGAVGDGTCFKLDAPKLGPICNSDEAHTHLAQDAEHCPGYGAILAWAW